MHFRRLRTALRSFAPYFFLEEEASAKAVSKALRALGAPRDIDVMMELLAEISEEACAELMRAQGWT